jgi:putative chitinase
LELPGPAAFSAAWFWFTKGLNTIMDKPDMWRGNRGKYKNLSPFEYCSVVINGGLNGFADRKKHFENCKTALGIK